MTRRVRWNADLAEFELQCPQCRAESKPSYWPITREFWLPQRPSRCRACWQAYDRRKRKATRQDEAVRLREAQKVAAWRERNPGYNVATAALWRENNRERKRATDRAAYRRRATMIGTVLGPSSTRDAGWGTTDLRPLSQT